MIPLVPHLGEAITFGTVIYVLGTVLLLVAALGLACRNVVPAPAPAWHP
jgi:hypothetical protein